MTKTNEAIDWQKMTPQERDRLVAETFGTLIRKACGCHQDDCSSPTMEAPAKYSTDLNAAVELAKAQGLWMRLDYGEGGHASYSAEAGDWMLGYGYSALCANPAESVCLALLRFKGVQIV